MTLTPPEYFSPIGADSLEIAGGYEVRPTDAANGNAANRKKFWIIQTAVIEGDGGEAVRSLTEQVRVDIPPRASADEYHPQDDVVCVWDGRNEAGEMVPDGTYTWLVDARYVRLHDAGNSGKTQEHLVGVSNTISGTIVVDTVPPRKVSALPADGATDIPLYAMVELLFDGSMDTGSVEQQFVLREAETETEVEGDFCWPNDAWMVFWSHAYLLDNTEYEIMFRSPPLDPRGVLLDGDGDGSAGGDFHSYFTTVETGGGFLVEIPATSKTSPAFIEGEYWWAEGEEYTIIGEGPEGPVDADMLDERHFFVDIPIEPGDNEVSIRQEGTAPLVQVTDTVTWTPTVIDTDSGQSVTIRKGDSLLLVTEETTGTLEIDLDYYYGGRFDEDLHGPAGTPIPAAFNSSGDFTVHARVDGEFAGEMTVLVIEVDIWGPIACQVGYTREKRVWVNPFGWPEEEVHFGAVDPDYLGGVAVKEYDNAGAIIDLTPLKSGTPVLTARINGETGPIVAWQEVDEFTLDNTAAELVHVREVAMGVYESHGTYFTMDPRMPDPNIEFTSSLCSTGMTFEDGTSYMTFTAADFVLQEDGTGVYEYTVYFVEGYGPFCMETYIEQYGSVGFSVGHRLDDGEYCSCYVFVDAPASLNLNDTAFCTATFSRCQPCVDLGHTGEEYAWTTSDNMEVLADIGTSILVRALSGARYGSVQCKAVCPGCKEEFGVEFCAFADKMIRVKAKPHAEASATAPKWDVPVTVTYSAAGSNDDDDAGEIVEYKWMIADSGPFYGEERTVDYTAAGIPEECGPVVTKATGSPTSGEVPLTVSFQGEGKDPNPLDVPATLTVKDDDGLTDQASAPITLTDPGDVFYEWDFGDGSPKSSAQNPSHTYEPEDLGPKITEAKADPSSGPPALVVLFTSEAKPDTRQYAATLTVKDEHGNTAVATVPVTVSGQEPITYRWDFDDGGSSNQADVVHTYEDPGWTLEAIATVTPPSGPCPLDVSFSGNHMIRETTYNAILTVTDRRGKTDATTVPVKLTHKLPITYEWDFGDGSPKSTLKNPPHTYHGHGTHYTATLTVTDADGFSATGTVGVYVYPAELGDITAKRKSSPEESHYEVNEGEHFEVGGEYEFKVDVTGCVPDILSYEIWDLDLYNERIDWGPTWTVSGVKTSYFRYVWAAGLDEGDVYVRFYFDDNGNGERDWGEENKNSNEFWVMKKKIYNVNTEVSDQLPPIYGPEVQARFDGAASILTKKDSAADWRACVGFNVLTITPFAANGDRPDPCDNVRAEQDKHFLQPSDIVLLNDLVGHGGLTVQGDWHQIIIDWNAGGSTWLERAIAHEFGHGVGLGAGHIGYAPPYLMHGGILGANDTILKRTDIDNYDGGPEPPGP